MPTGAQITNMQRLEAILEVAATGNYEPVQKRLHVLKGTIVGWQKRKAKIRKLARQEKELLEQPANGSELTDEKVREIDDFLESTGASLEDAAARFNIPLDAIIAKFAPTGQIDAHTQASLMKIAPHVRSTVLVDLLPGTEGAYDQLVRTRERLLQEVDRIDRAIDALTVPLSNGHKK